jgi:hypothetical protein
MRRDELEDGKEEMEAVPLSASLEVPHHHLSAPPTHISFLVPVCPVACMNNSL